MSEWFEAYENWKKDCLEEYNKQFDDRRKYYCAEDFDESEDEDVGLLVEFGEDGTAYPHGIGGVTYIRNAVTPWEESKHYLP